MKWVKILGFILLFPLMVKFGGVIGGWSWFGILVFLLYLKDADDARAGKL